MVKILGPSQLPVIYCVVAFGLGWRSRNLWFPQRTQHAAAAVSGMAMSKCPIIADWNFMRHS
jgi:hypothetical protein